MESVRIVGVGMTPFRRDPHVGLKRLANLAAGEALADSGLDAGQLDRIYFGNAVAPTVVRQDMIRGQVAFRDTPFARLPMVNIENACASGGTAFNLAFEAVAAGLARAALVIGVEQLSHDDRQRTFSALRGSTDIEEIGEGEEGAPVNASILMDYYAQEANSYMRGSGATEADFARVAVKNRRHAGANPLAQFRTPQTVEEVLAARAVAQPLTLPMCSPITDGAAALVVCSDQFAREHGLSGPRVAASRMAPGMGRKNAPLADATAAAYAAAGLGPRDIDLIELHDAAAPAELIQYADIGLCSEGEGHELIRRGDTAREGKYPVNVSGGLMSRGHPLGATGCAQLVELSLQLAGRAGDRQIDGARVGLAANAGGWLNGAYAIGVSTILVKT